MLNLFILDTKMETADSAAVIKSEGADIAGGGSEDVEMEDAEGSSGASAAVAKKAKTDQQVSDDFKTVMNDTAFLQQVLENLPEGSQQPPIKQETIDAANNLVKEKAAAAAAAKTKTSPTTAKKSTTSSGSPKSPSSGSSGSGKKSSGGNNDNKDKDKKKKPEPKK